MGARVETGPPPTPQPELFSLEEEPSGTRPDRIAAGLPNLDDSAPQMVEQLADVIHFFDTLTPDPEQVVEVPKILLDDVPVRTAVRVAQLVEQL